MNENNSINYQIIINSRAKHIRLRICPKRGLLLVLPSKRHLSKGLEFLISKQDWAAKHVKKIVPIAEFDYPEILKLDGLNKTLIIKYDPLINSKSIDIFCANQRLTLLGDIKNTKICIKAIKKHLKNIAKLYFLNKVNEYADKYQLPYKKLIIREQSTRWGSCSHEKSISLNLKLLFMPAICLEYVICHELAHTKYFDHSPAFWQQVADIFPDYAEAKTLLKKLSGNIPAWFL